MASIYKVDGGWRAQVARKGVRQSRTFVTKAAAEAWALRLERDIIDGEVQRWPAKTVADAIHRYEREVTPGKASAKAEGLRFGVFLRSYPDLAGKVLHTVTPADVAAWRDAEVKRVLPSTVKRTANSLRAVWTVAVKEWGWAPSSPWTSIKLPSDSPPRTRLAGWREVRLILRRCGYVTGQPPVTGMQQVGWAFLVSLRTAMRAGEVMGLQRADVAQGVVTLKAHKTAHLYGQRQVPLTKHGRRLLAVLDAFAAARGRAGLFTIKTTSLDALFRKVTAQCLLDDLHFHDARGTALTHLSRRMDVMQLARISGHRDLRVLMSVYYRQTAQSIAAGM